MSTRAAALVDHLSAGAGGNEARWAWKELYAGLALRCVAETETSEEKGRLSSLLVYVDVLGDEEAARLALSLRKIGALADACRAYDLIIARCPLPATGHLFEAAATFKRAGQVQKIRDLCERALAEAGSNPNSLVAVARLNVYSGNIANVRRLVAEVEVEARNGLLDFDAYVSLAEIAFRSGLADRTAYMLQQAKSVANGRRPTALFKTMARTAAGLRRSIPELAADYVEGGHRPSVFVPDALFDRLARDAASQSTASLVAEADMAGGLLVLVNSLAVGGSERNAIVVANAFGASAHFPWTKIAVVDANVSDPAFKTLVAPGIEVVSVATASGSADGAIADEYRTTIQAITTAGSAKTIGDMAVLFCRLRPAVVHVYASDVRVIQAAAAGMVTGTPVILNPGGFTPAGRGRGEDYEINERWMRNAYRAVLTHPRVHMLNCSIAAGAEYCDWIQADPAKFSVNYFGIDLQSHVPEAERVDKLRAQLGLTDQHFVVGGVFRFEEVKRPLLWLEVAAVVARQAPDARFVLIGGGELLDAARQHARKLGIEDRTTFAGRQLDPVNWYPLMSCYLQTSSSEGLGNVLIEAQALGVPVVVPMIGGMPETLVHGRTGRIAADDTATSLAAEILKVRSDPLWRRKASLFARSFVRERFARTGMIQAHQSMYDAISPSLKAPTDAE